MGSAGYALCASAAPDSARTSCILFTRSSCARGRPAGVDGGPGIQEMKPMLRLGRAFLPSSSAISRLMASKTEANCSS